MGQQQLQCFLMSPSHLFDVSRTVVNGQQNITRVTSNSWTLEKCYPAGAVKDMVLQEAWVAMAIHLSLALPLKSLWSLRTIMNLELLNSAPWCITSCIEKDIIFEYLTLGNNVFQIEADKCLTCKRHLRWMSWLVQCKSVRNRHHYR